MSTPDDCLFCRVARGELPVPLLHEDAHCLAFRDLHPQAPTHALVIPRRHIASMAEIEEADAPLLAAMARAARRVAAIDGIEEGGWRVVTNVGRDGGQSVFHLHWHVLGGRAMAWPPG